MNFSFRTTKLNATYLCLFYSVSHVVLDPPQDNERQDRRHGDYPPVVGNSGTHVSPVDAEQIIMSVAGMTIIAPRRGRWLCAIVGVGLPRTGTDAVARFVPEQSVHRCRQCSDTVLETRATRHQHAQAQDEGFPDVGFHFADDVLQKYGHDSTRFGHRRYTHESQSIIIFTASTIGCYRFIIINCISFFYGRPQ